ncbi:UDP-glycosyltransferase 43-like [Humulus lupulus]|uniref:UDP-glycosyltransferase 43-like n=1 Tax=Humulus lupulus TaxID=3486 RepID=UPI002B40B43B|nr:UDP-glycosyltransferase 43-like [Humulus lupulus]
MASSSSSMQNHVFLIATPAIGLLTPTVELARRLVDRFPGRLSAIVLLISVPQWPTVHSYVQSLHATSSPNLSFLILPAMEPPSTDQFPSYVANVTALVDQQKVNIKDAIVAESKKRRVVGLIVDLFCTFVTDVANDLGIPSYLFYASPAAFFSYELEMSNLASDESLTELTVRGFANSVPRRVLRRTEMERSYNAGFPIYLDHARRFTQMKGIIVNTVQELEPFALDSLSASGGPKVYPIGPVLNLKGSAQWNRDGAQKEKVIGWLDNQPKSSVVFLCFGSWGSLSGPQVKEIAIGLERAGLRFLWALREPPKSNLVPPSDFSNVDGILPNGFLERTARNGLVCGWVPQMTILSHQAIGGFVSHCGWNSTLESLWCGVPVATWPIYAEQHMNAFLMVKELGLSNEISLDYEDGVDLVSAEEVERGVKKLMESDNMLRVRVKDVSEKCRLAMTEHGSSYTFLGDLVEELTSPI